MIDEEMNELFGSNEVLDISLSFSRVSDFDRNGPRALNKRTTVNNDGAKIGSVVDDLLFDKDNFDKKYYIYDGTKPTATLGKLVDIIIANYVEIPDKNTILEIIAINDFWKRSSEDTVLSYFNIPEFWDYLDAQYASLNKQVITTEELELSKELVSILETHPYSSNIFKNDYDVYNQYKFELLYNNVIFKGIIDIILIDHINKTIKFIDLKTGPDSADNFINSFIKYRYYFQEAIYTKAFDAICESLSLKDYILLPFEFLYIGRKEKIPLLFTINDKWHKAAITGFRGSNGYYYKGLDQIIEEIKWHWNNKIFDTSREVHESFGKLVLDDKFITNE